MEQLAGRDVAAGMPENALAILGDGPRLQDAQIAGPGQADRDRAGVGDRPNGERSGRGSLKFYSAPAPVAGGVCARVRGDRDEVGRHTANVHSERSCGLVGGG